MKKKITSLKIGDTFKTDSCETKELNGPIIELYSYCKEYDILTLAVYVPALPLYTITGDEFKRALKNGELYQEES